MVLPGSIHTPNVKICLKKFLKNWQPHRAALKSVLGKLKIMAFLVFYCID